MFGIDDVIGAGAAVAGSAASGLFSARQASIDKGWQETMRGTAIQAQMADMAAGGINPIMAARIGGAPMPAAPNMGSMPAPDVAGSVLRMSTARQARAEADIAESKAELLRRQVRPDPDKPQPSVIDTMPAEFQGTARAIKNLVGEGSDRVLDFLDPGGSRVEDMLRGRTKGPTAVESGRSSGAAVLPGGAVVGRGIPGQLNILRLKRGR